MPLKLINPGIPFEILVINFVNTFPIQEKRTCAKYIITTVEYLTKWAIVELVESCTKEVATKFIYESIITIFECPLTLISVRGTHFVNVAIQLLLQKIMMHHRGTTNYHP